MKRIGSIYYLILVISSFIYACSYDDKTTYADEFIPNIIIDTAGIPT